MVCRRVATVLLEISSPNLGLRFWGAYIWRGLYMEGLIFGILRYLKRRESALWYSITINAFYRIDFKRCRKKTGHLAPDDMRFSMCEESKKHLLFSIFDLYKKTSFFQFLSIAPDTCLPQILVFKEFSARHICHILYPREYILHAQGINESNAHSENAFSLFSCVWTLAW